MTDPSAALRALLQPAALKNTLFAPSSRYYGLETATLTVVNAVSMTNASDNSCQGAVFTVPVSVTAVSNA